MRKQRRGVSGAILNLFSHGIRNASKGQCSITHNKHELNTYSVPQSGLRILHNELTTIPPGILVSLFNRSGSRDWERESGLLKVTSLVSGRAGI